MTWTPFRPSLGSLLALLLLTLALVAGACDPTSGDDDDSGTGDDDDSGTGDDDDSGAGDDDDSGTGDDDDSGAGDDDSAETWDTILAITGGWTDAFSGTHDIDNASWEDSFGSVWNISQFANTARYVVAQNDPANTYYPGDWSRFDWYWDGNNGLHYCQTCYDCADEAAAMNTTPADPGSLTGTCGGSDWTSMTPKTGTSNLAISGNWTDNWGGTHSIDTATWEDGYGSVWNISQYANGGQNIVAQNDTGNVSNAGLWSRFDWHWNGDNDLYYCQTCFDCADEAAALGAGPGDAIDLVSGCGGFSWSSMTPSP